MYSDTEKNRFNGIKKESPNEGTETHNTIYYHFFLPFIKKESPNEGTETRIRAVLK